MYETMALDSKTIVVKSDNERELSEIIDFISKKDKEMCIKSFLQFAAGKQKIAKDYKFNRAECYGR